MTQEEVLPRDGIQVFIPPAGNGRSSTKRAGMRILVAEDDQEVRTLVSMLLRLDGHQVIEAPSPVSALEQAVEAHPDLIILDVNFPVSDGLPAVHRLREMGQTRDLPIILFSGSSRNQDAIRGLEGGADAYVIKPVDPFIFLETVWEVTTMSRDERDYRREKELARLRRSA